ncbi:MAG: C40 family peptidase [Flavobacteriales bacterium]
MIIRVVAILLIGLFFSSFRVAAQNMRKVDKLEMLYDQGNFRAIVRRTNRMIKNDEYNGIAAPYFFRSMAKLQLNYKDGIIQDGYSMSEIASDFNRFLQLDSNAYWARAYASYFYETRQEIYGYLGVAAGDDPSQLVNEKFQELSVVFGNEVAFKDVITVSNPPDKPKPISYKDKGNIYENVVSMAESHVGKPYQFGATGPNSFDCSGFTWYIWNKNGIDLPRSSSDQASAVSRIRINDVQKGDLLFFGRSDKTISHVGIVVSEKGQSLKMIHASSSIGISYVNVNEVEYWKNRLQFAGRVKK